MFCIYRGLKIRFRHLNLVTRRLCNFCDGRVSLSPLQNSVLLNSSLPIDAIGHNAGHSFIELYQGSRPLSSSFGDTSQLARRPSDCEDLDSSGGKAMAVVSLRLLRRFVPRNNNGDGLATACERTSHNDNWLSSVYISDIVR